MLYPLTFEPILKERVWGGRNLERLYGKVLPPAVPIGESWEISDRPGDASVIRNGPLVGKDLRWLMEHHARDLLGHTTASADRFPLLVKILDAADKLSLQVHPPAVLAAKLGGEPKTEMWYIAEATPEAALFVGLKRGTTRAEFQRKAVDASVAECFHRQAVKAGDAMFLPSGRVHAIGPGNVVFEIQQNSDTTYRVFDWNRVGLDGCPRELHLEQSMASIDFNDLEPALIQSNFVNGVRPLVDDTLFSAQAVRLTAGHARLLDFNAAQIVGVLRGRVRVRWQDTELTLHPGEFCLLPSCLKQVSVAPDGDAEFLQAQPGK